MPASTVSSLLFVYRNEALVAMWSDTSVQCQQYTLHHFRNWQWITWKDFQDVTHKPLLNLSQKQIHWTFQEDWLESRPLDWCKLNQINVQWQPNHVLLVTFTHAQWVTYRSHWLPDAALYRTIQSILILNHFSVKSWDIMLGKYWSIVPDIGKSRRTGSGEYIRSVPCLRLEAQAIKRRIGYFNHEWNPKTNRVNKTYLCVYRNKSTPQRGSWAPTNTLTHIIYIVAS